MTSNPHTVVVTGVGGGGLGEQIVKALRLSSVGYWIVACDSEWDSVGRVVGDVFLRVPRADNPAYPEAIAAVCRSVGASTLLLGTEVEIRRMAVADPAVLRGIFCPMDPPSVLDVCLDKAQTMARIEELSRGGVLGFRAPRSFPIQRIEDIEAVRTFPAIVKPAVGGGGSAEVTLVQCASELCEAVVRLLRLGVPPLVQEYVGRADEEYTVGVLTSMNGTLIQSIAMRRRLGSALSARTRVPNRTDRPDLGPVLAISTGISQGELGPFPEVCGPCETLALALGCRGATNFQCRLVDGVPYIFEINPRFSGTVSARALVGFNEPDVLIRYHVLGGPLPVRFPYRTGTVLRGLTEYLLP